jgi:ankyrin repeat protein/DNA replication protein DnaC
MKSENHINSSNQSVLNILYDNRISAKTILEHKDLLSDLARGQTAHGANLEKLRNHDVWSIRTNRKGRILYTYRNIKGIKHILVLEILDNHEYDKSKFLQKQVLAYHLEKNKEALDKVTEKDFEQTKIPVIIDSEFKNASFSLKPAYENNGTYIVLDEVQETSLSAKTPMVIEGPPGSGKTSLAEILLKQAVENKKCVLYVTQSFLLADKIKSAWMASAEYVAGKADVMAYDALLQDLQVDGKKIFEIWFSTSIKEIVKDKNAAARFVKEIEKVFEEFRIISGYSKQEYTTKEGIGQKQCLYKEVKDRELLYSIYEAWKAHLAANNIKLSEFYDFRKELKGKYDLVIVDESQDLSHIQLYNLSRLCKKLNIIYCIDPRQNLQDENPKLIYLKQMLTNKGHQQPTLVQLLTHYRCPKRIMDFALVFNQLRIQLAPKNKAESKIADTDNMEGQLEWIDPKDSKGLAKLKILSTDANACVVTQKEFITEVREKLKITQVFTPEQVKGLEYKSVVLYKILNTNTLREVNKVLEQATGKEDEMYSAALSGCFVASTRATESLYVVQNEDRVNHIVKKLRDKVDLNALKIKSDKESSQSTKEEWETRARILVQNGNLEQARGILINQLGFQDDLLITKQLNLWDPKVKNATKSEQKENVKENIEKVSHFKITAKKRRTKRKKNEIPLGIMTITESNAHKKKHDLKNSGVLKKRNTPKKTIKIEEIAIIRKFFDAVENGDIETCSTMLAFNKKLANLSEGGTSPLHLAALNGHIAIVRLLLKFGAECYSNIANFHQNHALNMAASKGHTEIVIEILNSGNLSQVQRDKDSSQAIIFAAIANRLETVIALLNFGADPNGDDGADAGMTPLHYAVKSGNVKMVRELLEADAFPSHPDSLGRTPLHYALTLNHTSIVQELLEGGADPNPESVRSKQLMEFALSRDNFEAAIMLYNAGAKSEEVEYIINDQIHFVAASRNLTKIKELIDKHADLNLEDVNGTTPLYVAAQYGYDGIVSLLVKGGADINLQRKDKNTALHIAAKNGHVKVVNTLLKHGANPNLQNDEGATPLHLAIENEHNDVVEELLFDERIDLEVKRNDGKTAIEIASQKENSPLLGFFEILKANTSFGNLDLEENPPTVLPMYNQTNAEQPFLQVLDKIESELKASIASKPRSLR